MIGTDSNVSPWSLLSRIQSRFLPRLGEKAADLVVQESSAFARASPYQGAQRGVGERY